MSSKSILTTLLWFKLPSNRNNFLFVCLFGIAFAMVEAAVVIYMRELYYPEGFSFPLKAISSKVLITEMWREVATIIMLITIGLVAGKNRVQRFAYFILSFAVWDIFYYIFLKAFIDWPESPLTWDVLFLLPVTWFGPVAAPVILSFLMIVLSVMLLVKNKWPNKTEWSLLIVGSFISIVSFTLDYLQYISSNSSGGNVNEHLAISVTYVPQFFDWHSKKRDFLMLEKPMSYVGILNIYNTV